MKNCSRAACPRPLRMASRVRARARACRVGIAVQKKILGTPSAQQARKKILGTPSAQQAPTTQAVRLVPCTDLLDQAVSDYIDAWIAA
jgi:hypothetical protein